MNLIRSFFFWLYMAAVFVAGGAVLVVSASGAITQFKHLRACSVDIPVGTITTGNRNT